MRWLLVSLLFVTSPGLASGDPPAPPEDLASAKVIRGLTQDEDGDERNTKIWVAVVSSEPYIRMANTRWYKNLERGSSLTAVMDEKQYPATAVRVQDTKLIEQMHANKFRQKYDFQDRLVGIFGGDYVLRLAAPDVAAD